MDEFLEEIKNVNFKNKSARNKVVSAKKAELVKEATRIIQEKFQGPLGEGLRCFIPQPQLGGQSACVSSQTYQMYLR